MYVLMSLAIQGRSRTFSVMNDKEPASDDFRFATAVAMFGMLLRNSEFADRFSWSEVKNCAMRSLGDDVFGYRMELVDLISRAERLSGRQTSHVLAPANPSSASR